MNIHIDIYFRPYCLDDFGCTIYYCVVVLSGMYVLAGLTNIQMESEKYCLKVFMKLCMDNEA